MCVSSVAAEFPGPELGHSVGGLGIRLMVHVLAQVQLCCQPLGCVDAAGRTVLPVLGHVGTRQ